MPNQFVTYEVEDQVATIRLSNPPANVLNSSLLAELDGVIDEIAKKNGIKAVVLAGSESTFVAGADIKEIAAIGSAAKGAELAFKGQAIFDKIEGLGKPVLAAINGFCLGGGLELAMSCHIRIAGDRARLGQPEINLGIIPGFGGTQRLPRIVGMSKATELILTGDMINAQEAKAIGLVNKVVPEGEVLKQAFGIAKKIAAKGGGAIAAAMRALDAARLLPLSNGLAAEAKYFGGLCESEDMKEGLSAFLEKRQPKFKDR